MLNVHADRRALRELQACSESLNREIEVRLHPNSSLGELQWPEGLLRADSAESLEEFARRHAILLCGNTQAQVKALADGTPVVHCAGLDPLEFDHHGYVENGILPGCKLPHSLDLPAVREFFASGRHKAALEAHMGPEPAKRKPDLSEFLKEICNKLVTE